MKDFMRDLVYSSDDSDSWFYQKYFCGGANFRYWTFQLSLNILRQTRENPTFVETGCQRMEEDIGAGMSTSIFGEYCRRYGGQVFTVDLVKAHLNICRECTQQYKDLIHYIESDSVAWLKSIRNLEADLLYLDSYDHPHFEILNEYGGLTDMEKAARTVRDLGQKEILRRHGHLLKPCQEHCLNEFLAAESSGVVKKDTLVLIDDNQLAGGGKSRLLKDYLREHEWICLFDLQQSLWVRKV